MNGQRRLSGAAVLRLPRWDLGVSLMAGKFDGRVDAKTPDWWRCSRNSSGARAQIDFA
jgi:hypothetical protein